MIVRILSAHTHTIHTYIHTFIHTYTAIVDHVPLSDRDTPVRRSSKSIARATSAASSTSIQREHNDDDDDNDEERCVVVEIDFSFLKGEIFVLYDFYNNNDK